MNFKNSKDLKIIIDSFNQIINSFINSFNQIINSFIKTFNSYLLTFHASFIQTNYFQKYFQIIKTDSSLKLNK